MFLKWNVDLPCDDNKEVEPVPRICQVGSLSVGPHGDHLDRHLQREEGEDKVVEDLGKETKKNITIEVPMRAQKKKKRDGSRDRVADDFRRVPSSLPCNLHFLQSIGNQF